MTTATHLSFSRTYPVTVEEAFDRFLPLPLEQVFADRYGPLPPILRTVQDGEWGVVGQRRTIVLAGPGQMSETLTHLDRPHSFGYELTDLRGPLALLAGHVAGVWRFEPAGTGVRITWSWDVTPRGRLGRPAMPAFGAFWRGYARAAFQRTEALLLAG